MPFVPRCCAIGDERTAAACDELPTTSSGTSGRSDCVDWWHSVVVLPPAFRRVSCGELRALNASGGGGSGGDDWVPVVLTSTVEQEKAAAAPLL